MKVLFITDNFPPESNAPATRTYEHCINWVKMNNEVTVITSFPNFPEGKVYQGYKNELYSKESLNGINVIRVWTYITRNKGFFRRTIDHISFAFSSLIYLLFFKKKFDIVIATSPQFFVGFSAMIYSNLKKIPWIFEVRDMWPEGIIFLKRKSLLYKFLEKIEGTFYKNANGIVTVTESFKSDIIKRFKISNCKLKVIYNGSNNSFFENTKINTKIISSLNLKDKFIIGYAGTLGISHSLDFVLECLDEIYELNPNIHFIFVGDGALKNIMHDIIKRQKLKNVNLIDKVEREMIKQYLSIFDFGLVPLKKNDAYKKVIPSKIYELAAMNIPVILGVEGESKDIISKNNAGISFVPENKESFIKACLDSYHLRNSEIFLDGLKNIKNIFDRDKMSVDMLNFMQKTLDENTYNK